MKKSTLSFLLTIISAFISVIFFTEKIIEWFNLDDALISAAERSPGFQTSRALLIIFGLEVLMLTMTLFVGKAAFGNYIIQTKEKSDTQKLLVINTKSFYKAVKTLIVSWLILYLWFLLSWIVQQKFSTSELHSIVWAGADVLHALTAMCFMYGFLTLKYPVKSIEEMEKTRSKHKSIFLVVCSISVLTAGLSIFGRFYLLGLDKIGVVILSFWCAICMQYFIGVLDQIHFEKKVALLAPMYLYVTVQVLWSVIDESISLETREVIFFTTFVLKFYLIGLLFYWAQRGRFSRHFGRFQKTQLTRD